MRMQEFLLLTFQELLMQVGQLAVMFIISFEMPSQKIVSSFQLTLFFHPGGLGGWFVASGCAGHSGSEAGLPLG